MVTKILSFDEDGFDDDELFANDIPHASVQENDFKVLLENCDNFDSQ